MIGWALRAARMVSAAALFAFTVLHHEFGIAVLLPNLERSFGVIAVATLAINRDLAKSDKLGRFEVPSF